MGFFTRKIEEKETINNEEMFLAIKEQTERMFTSMIGDALAINGSDLDEIDPQYVALFNKYVRQYKEMMDISLKWARSQDERDRETSEKLNKILGLLESRKKGGDRD